MREKLLERLRKDIAKTSIYRMAKRLDITYISLWRISNGTTLGNAHNWDKIYKYYGK